MLPTRSEIEELAKQRFAEHSLRNGIQTITPTREELAEGGWLSVARSELMRDNARAQIEEYFVSEDQVSVGIKVDLEECKKTGVLITGNRNCGKSNTGFLLVDKLMKDSVICLVVDPSGAWKKSSIPRIIKVPKKGAISVKELSTIFDVSLLYPKEIRRFVSNLCHILINNRARIGFDRPYLCLVLEEAHLVVGTNRLRANEYEEVLRYLTIGRNYGCTHILIAQRAATVDSTAIALCGQKFLGRIDEENDRSKLRNWIGEYANKLDGLETGEFCYDYGNHTEIISTPLFKSKTKPMEISTFVPSKSIKTQRNPNVLKGVMILISIVGFAFVLGAFLL